MRKTYILVLVLGVVVAIATHTISPRRREGGGPTQMQCDIRVLGTAILAFRSQATGAFPDTIAAMGEVTLGLKDSHSSLEEWMKSFHYRKPSPEEIKPGLVVVIANQPDPATSEPMWYALSLHAGLNGDELQMETWDRETWTRHSAAFKKGLILTRASGQP